MMFYTSHSVCGALSDYIYAKYIDGTRNFLLAENQGFGEFAIIEFQYLNI